MADDSSGSDGERIRTTQPVTEDRVVPDADPNARYLDRTQEFAREHFGWGVFWLLVGTLVSGPLLYQWNSAAWDAIKDVYKSTVAAEVTLLATVIGYYYGSRK